MDLKDIRMVVADLDMTIDEVGHPLPMINKAALEALHERDYLFALASGRTVEQLADKISDWGLSFKPDLLIGVNGSSIYDRSAGKKEDLLTFEKEWISEIFDLLTANDFTFHVYIDDYTIFNRKGRLFDRIYADTKRDMRISDDKNDYVKDGFFKFLLADENDIESFKKVFEPLEKKHRNDFKLIMTTKFSYEIVHAKTSKAYGLKIFMDRHGLSPKQVLSFGDADNDCEMFELSGHSVCMRNGTEYAKSKAEAISEYDCNEGGFGHYLFDHLLD